MVSISHDQLLLTAISTEHWNQDLLPLLAAWLHQLWAAHSCGLADNQRAACWLHALLLSSLLLSFCVLLGIGNVGADL
jgi:hypothetical protein